MLAQCNTPLAVTVSMEIRLEFTAGMGMLPGLSPGIKMAVEAGIASAAGVSSEAVVAVLTVASRRLDLSQRRLQSNFNVNIDATIHTLDTNEVETLRQTVAVIEPSAMTASINAAFNAAFTGAVTVEVAAIGLPVVAPPASGTAESEAATQSESAGSDSSLESANEVSESDSRTLKVTVSSGVLAVLAAAM